MELASYILFALGILGGIDIATYHTIAHGIRTHADSRNELIVHSLRGPTYASLFLTVPNFVLHGAFYWCLIALLAIDVLISIADFMLEGESRRLLGGLPAGEYVLHIIMAMFFGGLVTAIGFQAGESAAMPARMSYAPADVPAAIRLALAAMAVLVFASGIQDALAALRLGRQVDSLPNT